MKGLLQQHDPQPSRRLCSSQLATTLPFIWTQTSLVCFCSDVFGKVSGLSIVTLDVQAKGKEMHGKLMKKGFVFLL